MLRTRYGEQGEQTAEGTRRHDLQDVRNKRVVVAGLGHFGGNVAAARWLVGQGARVLVTDKAPADKLSDSLERLKDLPIEYRLGEHRGADFSSAGPGRAPPPPPPPPP